MLTNKFNLYKSGWIELVFLNRNQTYGAYELRKNSALYLLRALLAGMALFLTAVLTIWYSGNRSDEVATLIDIAPRMIETPVVPPQAKKTEPPKPAVTPRAQPKVATKKFASFKPVKDELAVTPPPTIKELENVQIGPIDIAGEKGAAPTSVEITGENSSGGTGTAPESIIYGTETLERMPEFAGGLAGWAKYLQRNLRYPERAVESETQGRVVVSFVVETDGSLSHVHVISGIGSGCDEEALRVLKKAPNWTPGIQNGHPVRVQYTLPIAFRLN